MSRASEWAKRLAAVNQERHSVYHDQKPGTPEDVYIIGNSARLRLGISDEGMPTIHMIPADPQQKMGGVVRFTEDVEKLLHAAQWIIDTFSDEPRAGAGPSGPPSEGADA
jgi:hypothetical protein